MRTAISFLLILASPLPVMAQSADPYEEAVAARRAGDPERAVALLRPLVEADPDHVDARLQLGFALLALERIDEAEQAFRTVLAAAPDYADARIGLARIAQRRGDRTAALAELRLVPAGYPELEALRRQLTAVPAARRSWRLEIDGSYSALEDDRSDWQELAVQLRHDLSAVTALTGRAQAARRFGFDDVYGEIRLDRILSDRLRAYASVGATADPDFLPEWHLWTPLRMQAVNSDVLARSRMLSSVRPR